MKLVVENSNENLFFFRLTGTFAKWDRFSRALEGPNNGTGVYCNLKAFMSWETVAFRKGILKNLTKFTGVGPCNFIKNETLAYVFSRKFCGTLIWIFRAPPVAASSVSVTELTSAVKIIVFKIIVKYFLLITSGNLYKVFPSWIRFCNLLQMFCALFLVTWLRLKRRLTSFQE